MLDKYPHINEYWEDKRADISRINVPAYVLASYSTFLYTMGSFQGYEELEHDQKWWDYTNSSFLDNVSDEISRLRVHPTQEWHDLYQSSTNDELQLFFDRYTKGVDNGWEETPRVRVSLLQFNKVGCRQPGFKLYLTLKKGSNRESYI